MKPFKRGFVQKCAQYGIEKEQAKGIYKSALAQADVMNWIKAHAPELIGGGVGALGGGALGYGMSNEGNKGTGTALGALGGGLAGAGAGYLGHKPIMTAWDRMFPTAGGTGAMTDQEFKTRHEQNLAAYDLKHPGQAPGHIGTTTVDPATGKTKLGF